jgi:hypothetical protein
MWKVLNVMGFKRYKKARKDAWDKLSNKDKEKFTNLPHFDKNIFFEIT